MPVTIGLVVYSYVHVFNTMMRDPPAHWTDILKLYA